ncbi:unnamed protein product [Sphagnum balticum]
MRCASSEDARQTHVSPTNRTNAFRSKSTGRHTVKPAATVREDPGSAVANSDSKQELEVIGKTTKCIAEEIQSDVLVVDDYKVVSTSQDDLSVTAKVTSPRGNQLHHLENVHSGQFAFTSKESGKYVACFWLQSAHPNVHLNLALDWKIGVGAKD